MINVVASVWLDMILFVNVALLWYEVLTVEHVSCEAVDGESGVGRAHNTQLKGEMRVQICKKAL